MYHRIKEMLKRCNRHPTLFIECGCNDIGNPHNSLEGLQKYMKLTVSKIRKLLPKTFIVWSHLLLRRNLSFYLSNKDEENWKKRINSALDAFVVKNARGASIKYHNILSTQIPWWYALVWLGKWNIFNFIDECIVEIHVIHWQILYNY